MTQEGIILSLQQIALVPVLFAGLLQFSLISPNVKILSHIIASHWTFPNALLQYVNSSISSTFWRQNFSLPF
jgi:hypothetical protein